jgi:hypothetical protein
MYERRDESRHMRRRLAGIARDVIERKLHDA